MAMKELFSPKTGHAVAVDDLRFVYVKTPLSLGWRRVGKLKEHVSVDGFVERRVALGYREMRPSDIPTMTKLTAWVEHGFARATDGCKVEPDGVCEHGCDSWLIRCGLI